MVKSYLLNTIEAAIYLKIKPKTLRFWNKKKKGPTFYKIGHFIRYKLEDLDAFIEAQKVDPKIISIGSDNTYIGPLRADGIMDNANIGPLIPVSNKVTIGVNSPNEDKSSAKETDSHDGVTLLYYAPPSFNKEDFQISADRTVSIKK